VTALAARVTAATCGCGQPVPDAFLCAPCTRDLQEALQAITGTGSQHGLATDLDLALSRQGSHSGAGVRRGCASVVPFDERAAAAARRLLAALSYAWGCVCMDDARVSQPRRDLTDLARWLLTHIRPLRQLEDAAVISARILAAVAAARRAVDLPPERLYAGPCGHCRTPLYADPGAAWVTCHRHDPAWGALVEARRDWMLAQVTDVLAHAAEAVRLLGLVGVDVRPVQVSRWAARGRLPAHGTDQCSRALYRLGDLIILASG
jgi:hypothetical protein